MKILIIGLRREKLSKLKEKFNSFSFEGFDSQDSHLKLKHKSNPSKYDMVISITKFTNHQVERQFNKFRNYYRIGHGGGISAVSALIDQVSNANQISAK